MSDTVTVNCSCKGRIASCPLCRGTGRRVMTACRRCKGTGDEGGRKCLDCRGDGYRDIDQPDPFLS